MRKILRITFYSFGIALLASPILLISDYLIYQGWNTILAYAMWPLALAGMILVACAFTYAFPDFWVEEAK